MPPKSDLPQGTLDLLILKIVALGPAPDPQAEVQMNVARVESLTQHLRSYPEDVGAMEDMWQRLRTVAAQGTAVLLISTELDEIMALADRVAVIQKGRIVGTMARDEVEAVRWILS